MRVARGGLALLLLAVALLAGPPSLNTSTRGPRAAAAGLGVPGSAAPLRARPPRALAYARLPAPPARRVPGPARRAPSAGLLWDLDDGRVLWAREPGRPRPIASLTKMMTALVAVERHGPRSGVRITRQALAYRGSGVGVFKRGSQVRLDTMLYGLLLPSGNDAAIAIAQHVGGSVPGFVALMNERARALGLRCTHFSSPDGFEDRGNHSCPRDLAVLAREVLRTPRLARIVGARRAFPRAPIRGGRLYLYNNNPLLRARYPGTLGVKTGFTAGAGSCLVAAARRGRRRLGVVLLHSPDTGTQARQLLGAGFRSGL